MPNVRAFRSGNWSDTNPATSPWGTGGVIYAPAANDSVWLNNFNVALDVSATVISITNGAASSQVWKDGATTTAAAGGTLSLSNGVTFTGNVQNNHGTASTISITGTNSANVVGNVFGNSAFLAANNSAITLNTTGSLNITGNVAGSDNTGWASNFAILATAGTLNIVGNVSGGAGAFTGGGSGPCHAIRSTTNVTINITGILTGNGNGSAALSLTGSSIVTVVGNCVAGSVANSNAINSTSATAQISVVGDILAQNGVHAVVVVGNANVVFSGSFLSSADGTQPVYCTRYRVSPAPLNGRTRYAVNGVGSYLNMYTSDNNLGQANPTDVRSGVSYASGNLTGRLTVPARGSVALSVNYGPSMPFTATCSGTTATATLAYSYPLVVGDQITVTGASNNEWNSTYTIASVVSGTSVTFTVPATHSATAGTGALMQTTGTAVLDPAAVASAVWGAATRTLTADGGISASDVWDYATRTLTSASGPTAVEIRQEMDSNSTKLANLDTTVSSRLAPNGTLATVTTLTNAPASVTPQQIRAEMDANSTKLANLDTTISSRLATSAYTAPTAAPTAAQNATAVWGAATKEITGGTVTTLTNAPSVPSAASIRAEIDSNSTQLAAIKAKTDLLPASPAATGDIPSANITAIKAKTDLLNTDRLAQVSTVSTTGAQLAAALS